MTGRSPLKKREKLARPRVRYQENDRKKPTEEEGKTGSPSGKISRE